MGLSPSNLKSEVGCYPFKACIESGDTAIPSNKDYQKECKWKQYHTIRSLGIKLK